MNDHCKLRETPEEKELERKRSELKELEIKLTQRELDLVNLHIELRNFEDEYHNLVSSRFAQLERIEMQINEYIEYLRLSKKFKPSDSLKKLYREVAKQIHPDLAANESEKLRRQELMVQANDAYEQQDEERLQRILQEWMNSPDVINSEDMASELMQILQKIDQVSSRIEIIEQEMILLTKTELYELKKQVDEAKEKGINLLKSMAKDIENQILEAQQRLDSIKLRMEI